MFCEKKEFADLLSKQFNDEHGEDDYKKTLRALIKKAKENPNDSEWQFMVAEAFSQTSDTNNQYELYYLNCTLEANHQHFSALIRRAEIYYLHKDYLNCFNDIIAAEIIYMKKNVLDDLDKDSIKKIHDIKCNLWSNIDALSELRLSYLDCSDSKRLEESTKKTSKVNCQLESDMIFALETTIQEYRSLLLKHDQDKLKIEISELKQSNYNISEQNRKAIESIRLHDLLLGIHNARSDINLNYFYINTLITDFYMIREEKPRIGDSSLESMATLTQGNSSYCKSKTNSFNLIVATVIAKLASMPQKLQKSEVGKDFNNTLATLNKILNSEKNEVSSNKVVALSDSTCRKFYIFICISLENILNEINCLEPSISVILKNFQGSSIYKDACFDVLKIKHNLIDTLNALMTIKPEFLNLIDQISSSQDARFKFCSMKEISFNNPLTQSTEMKK